MVLRLPAAALSVVQQLSSLPRLWPYGVERSWVDLVEAVCTPRQRDVLLLKAHGYGNRRIARILGVSVSAIRQRDLAANDNIMRELARKEAA